MENTDWKRPVTADGQIDVRVGDVWNDLHGGIVRIVAIHGDLVWDGSIYTAHRDCMKQLVSRDGVPWDVPENLRKGRWITKDEDLSGQFAYDLFLPGWRGLRGGALQNGSAVWDGTDGLFWLPDAATPAEPVPPAEPQPGERWEDGRLVYRPIHDDNDGMLRYTIPNGTSWYLHNAHFGRNFAGYYYPAHGGKASAIRSDSLRYRNPHTGKCSTRYSPGDEIVRPTHVCFVKEAE